MYTESGCPNFYEKEKLFKYKRIPIFDNRGEDILSHINEVFLFIQEGKHYGNVLIHCLKGVSRSVSFVIAYLMKYNEMTLDEALAYIQVIYNYVILMKNHTYIVQHYYHTLTCILLYVHYCVYITECTANRSP